MTFMKKIIKLYGKTLKEAYLIEEKKLTNGQKAPIFKIRILLINL